MKASKAHVLTIPNIITIFRLILSFPIFYFLYQKKFSTGLVVALLAFVTDFLDGYLSRKLDAFSKVGEILDPLADRVVVISAAAGIFSGGRAPAGFFYLLLFREAIAVIGYVMLKKFVSKDFKIITEGKKVAAVIYILILLAIAFKLPEPVLYLVAFIYYLPFYFYLKQAKTLRRGEDQR